MTSGEAVKIIYSHIKKEPVVLATGYLCRAAQAVGDRPENFYMIGSMGMASPIALGIALSKPRIKILALDGDGAVLMNLGTLPVIGALKPANFFHLVIDNESYESTGGQPSYTAIVALEKIALASGYRTAKRVTSPGALRSAIKKLLSQTKGPAFLLVKTKEGPGCPPPRIQADPAEITRRFSESLGK
ncbi:MAG: sulfopyruvate decarboxylase subunit beta [Candidatus Omnitrophica bacterium]|nr:sulfopyruvate decarboxylase subunit beta [Candidatus Omnitrophota bacterium]